MASSFSYLCRRDWCRRLPHVGASFRTGKHFSATAHEVDVSFPKPSALVVHRSSALKAKPVDDGTGLPFGRIFTDHMLTIRWTSAGGWEAPTIEPFGHLHLHPASLAFNHGQAVFEGMKAFRGEDGLVRLFRPELNMQRFARSAARMSFPEIDPEALLGCLRMLVQMEEPWVPGTDGSCLYLRPVMLECGEVLGSFQSTECKIVVMCSPSGSYFGAGGIKPIKMLLNEEDVRAAKGGVGWCKHAGNYAPTFSLVQAARDQGCSQVLFTYRGEVGECAAMNVFFVLEGSDGQLELVTPPLDGTVLPGVTRQSVLDLARAGQLAVKGQENLVVSERPLLVEELKAAAAEGRLVEVFGSGTAVVVQPVEALVFPCGKEARCRSIAIAEMALRRIQDIQYARVPHDWSYLI